MHQTPTVGALRAIGVALNVRAEEMMAYAGWARRPRPNRPRRRHRSCHTELIPASRRRRSAPLLAVYRSLITETPDSETHEVDTDFLPTDSTGVVRTTPDSRRSATLTAVASPLQVSASPRSLPSRPVSSSAALSSCPGPTAPSSPASSESPWCRADPAPPPVLDPVQWWLDTIDVAMTGSGSACSCRRRHRTAPPRTRTARVDLLESGELTLREVTSRERRVDRIVLRGERRCRARPAVARAIGTDHGGRHAHRR